MNRIATSAAALALLMTSVAFAQTDPAAPDAAQPTTGQAAPATDTPPAASPAAESEDEDTDSLGQNEDEEEDEDESADEARRGGEGDRGGRHSMRHPGWRMHHPGAMEMGGGRQGAVFRFSGGKDGPGIVIRCAARDSTEECVEAIMPMLDKLLQLRAGGAPAQ